ncbi:hypothetical protein [Spiroplasma endosymbiont of 'Nebria riversi']|uniref:hypothetical protein n=1 Tax=Spiroplasma endosymbiont of 'Nebria riversi' TaxID=2792084 RepID=UPI001C046E43|nr:hypothetical protein [Spiroplasma endosymbiont of 'Nebria riversi']
MEKWTKKQELEIENDKLKIANVILENSVNTLKYIIMKKNNEILELEKWNTIHINQKSDLIIENQKLKIFKHERKIKMKKLLAKLFKKDNSKEKMPLKLIIKNSFKKQWLKVSLSIIFIFISLLICALTVIDTKWITITSAEFNDFMNKQMVDFFGKFNSGVMLAGIFVFWWGGAIYFAIKFEKLIRFIIQKIKAKRALKNEMKQIN